MPWMIRTREDRAQDRLRRLMRRHGERLSNVGAMVLVAVALGMGVRCVLGL